MKVLVVSDSHWNVENLCRAIEISKPALVIHLGDGWRDAEEAQRRFPTVPFEQVPGNCDFGQFEPKERIIFLENFRIMICHGHTLGVKSGLLRALYTARERDANALLFGHTHAPLIDFHEGVWLVNPGSVGSYRPSYCVLTVEGDKFSPANYIL